MSLDKRSIKTVSFDVQSDAGYGCKYTTKTKNNNLHHRVERTLGGTTIDFIEMVYTPHRAKVMIEVLKDFLQEVEK